MRSATRLRRTGALALLLAAGCEGVDPRPDYDAARAEVRATTGAGELHDPDAPILSDAELAAALADGLGLAEATRLALLNNRRLQAGFLAIGVARADYVQAGLLANPSLSLAFLFPSAGGRVRWTADVLGSVADIWQLPSRRALAQAGVELRILELSRFAGELVADTRVAYLESVAAREGRSIAATNLELARRSLDGVRVQMEAGVATRTDEGLAESLYLRAELAVRTAERAEVVTARRLAALLSLRDDVLPVALTDPLSAPSAPEVEREALVATSLTVRPDLRASERAVATAEERVALERKRRFPDVALGASAERPEAGSSSDLLVGPAATVELPLADRNHAQVARAELELAQRRKEHEALLAESGQAVRAAFDRAEVAARAATFARAELVPQAERNAALAARAYELGDTTVLTLLQAQQAALEARRTEIDARLEAALARIELERAAGAPLGGPTDKER
jgi:cobalt-zinc-cadmium efflux system outer membrane protein